MEPARSTDEFTRRITTADGNNIVAVLDLSAVNSGYQIFEQDYLVKFQVALEDLKVTVGLFSLSEAPWPEINALMSESQRMAEIAKVRSQGQKISLELYTAKGNGPWVYQSKVVLQNQGNEESHVPILVPFLSSNETLLVGGDFKLGARIEPIWNQPLKANDYLVIKGTYKQVVTFSKKKDDDLERLSARIETLELTLEGRLTNLPPNTLLGRNNSTAGTVQSIPQAQFIQPIDLATVFTDHTNSDTHSIYLTNSRGDARYVALTGTQTIAGSKTFSSSITSSGAFISTNINGRATLDHNGATALRLQAWGNSLTIYGQFVFNQYYSDGSGGRNAMVCNPDSSWNIGANTNTDANLNTVFGSLRTTGFNTLGDNVSIKLKRLNLTSNATQNGETVVAHGLSGDKILGFITKLSHIANGGLSPDFDTAATGYSFDVRHDATNFYVTNSPTASSLILGKPVTILIFYTS